MMTHGMTHGGAVITPPRRQLAYDRRCLALHEAGHITAARHRGVEAEGKIWSRHAGDPFSGKTWAGETTFTAPRHLFTPDTRRQIAVAGALAEFHDEKWFDPLDRGTWEEEPEKIMSLPDWDYAGYVPGEIDKPFMRAVAAVNNLFDLEWLAVCRTARDLIVRAVMTEA